MPALHIVRNLPDPPRKVWSIIGPGMVAAGVGLSSGEFILWPYIASQAGLIFLWGAFVGIGTQYFLNMEIERYTLATGETAMTGFNRIWKHWGLVLAIMVYFANLWPGWILSSATLATYLFGGGNAPVIAAVCLISNQSSILSPGGARLVHRRIRSSCCSNPMATALPLAVEPGKMRQGNIRKISAIPVGKSTINPV